MWYRTIAASAVLGVATLVGGCATDDHPQQIPMSAVLKGEGRSSVGYTAEQDGYAYVYDSRDDRVVWSGPVRKGQTVTLDGAKNRILVGDRLASEKVLRDGHDHQIYFEATRSGQRLSDTQSMNEADRKPAIENRVIVQPPADSSTSANTSSSTSSDSGTVQQEKVTVESKPAERNTTIERERVTDQP